MQDDETTEYAKPGESSAGSEEATVLGETSALKPADPADPKRLGDEQSTEFVPRQDSGAASDLGTEPTRVVGSGGVGPVVEADPAATEYLPPEETSEVTPEETSEVTGEGRTVVVEPDEPPTILLESAEPAVPGAPEPVSSGVPSEPEPPARAASDAADPSTTQRLDPEEDLDATAPIPDEEIEADSAATVDPDGTYYADDPESEPIEVSAPSHDVPAGGLAPGTVLFGEYEIVDMLGAGGMGEVYRARHRRLHETRAIKVMHPAVASDPTASEFFDREAKALLSVRHPAVVNCNDLLSDDEGRVYLVMEMIDGISLADRLARGGPLANQEVQVLARRIGAGLAAAHDCGVIHRDLSPDNIILPGGRPEEAKLIDFGIAKVLAAGQETILEGFKGKLAYASPEQLGFFDGNIDGRSDIYSLGLVLFAASTGRTLPMGNSVVEAVDARRNLTAVPDDCPPELRNDINKLLALHPDDRPASTSGMFGGATVLPGATEEPSTLAAAKPRLLRWGAGAGLAGLAAAAVFAFVPDATENLDAEPVSVVVPPPVVEEKAVEEPSTPVVAPPKPVVAKPPPPRRDRTADARTKLRIVGLLRGAQSALERDALMSPPGENAYDKFREVQKLDRNNKQARAGLVAVGGRYIELANAALAGGETAEAKGHLANARKVAPRHPDLAAADAALRAAGG